jgi:hypothetical protein
VALTQLSDVIIPAVYESYGFVPTPTLLSFLNSTAVRNDPFMNEVANREGLITTVPFWNDLDASTDPNISTDVTTDLATPQKITASDLTVRVGDYNNAWSAADLVAPLAGSNPMQLIKQRTNFYWSRQIQRFLASIALGIVAKNKSANSGDMTNNIAIADGNAAVDANLFSHNAVLDAIFTDGEFFGDLTGMVVPETVYKAMIKQEAISFVQPSKAAFKIPVYGEQCAVMPVNDALLSVAGGTSGRIYTTILCGSGAFAYGEGSALNPVEVRREPLQGNGGGVEVLVERKRWVFGVAGHSFLSASVAGKSPTSAEWGAAANWSRVYSRNQVPLAFLQTNG